MCPSHNQKYLGTFSYLGLDANSMDLTTLEMYEESVTFLQDRLPDQLRRPRVAIICGSGLGLLAETVEHSGKLSMSFNYAAVPHLPHPTVDGHAGRLVFGLMENEAVVLMSGRAHFYEGYSIEKITYPIRVFQRLGVQNIFVTNAAGGELTTTNVAQPQKLMKHRRPQSRVRGGRHCCLK